MGSDQVDEPYRHRIPLGLLMLSRRWITQEQLTRAIDLQKSAGHGKLGQWLIRTQGVDEQAVANALAAQWGLPFLPLDAQQDLRASRLLPRLFMEAFGVIPVRVAARKILYLAVEEQVDRCLHQALEEMTGLIVEPGVMTESAYSRLRATVFQDRAASGNLFSSSSMESLEVSISSQIEQSSAVWSRLVRVKHYIWLRIQTSGLEKGNGAQTEDIIFTLPPANS